MKASMTKELDLKEVIKAISSLPKGKPPGHDRILTKNFQDFVEEVAPTLLAAFKVMLKQGRTSTHINTGMITLIPKSGNHSRLENWSPITLLGSIYKILVKTLANKLQAILPLIIKLNKSGFVEGRSILDNTFLARKALNWAVESEQDLVLLLLDFEKGFVKIEWGFLFLALAKLGFSSKWIQ
jgi:hypothetical protein